MSIIFHQARFNLPSYRAASGYRIDTTRALKNFPCVCMSFHVCVCLRVCEESRKLDYVFEEMDVIDKSAMTASVVLEASAFQAVYDQMSLVD